MYQSTQENARERERGGGGISKKPLLLSWHGALISGHVWEFDGFDE